VKSKRPRHRLTVKEIIRHIRHRYQQCEWAIQRDEPFHDLESRKEELDDLDAWITKRQVAAMRH
jgi:hypothetical protein